MRSCSQISATASSEWITLMCSHVQSPGFNPYHLPGWVTNSLSCKRGERSPSDCKSCCTLSLLYMGMLVVQCLVIHIGNLRNAVVPQICNNCA